MFSLLAFFYLVGGLFLFFRVISALAGGHETGDTGEFHDAHLGDTSVEGEHGGVMVSHLFTLRNFLHFGIGFGAAGAMATNFGYAAEPACVAAVIGGFGLAAIGAWFFGVISRQQGNTVPSLAALAGKEGRVVTAIPDGGLGQVQVRNEFGTTVTMAAQSQGGALPLGSEVEVKSVVANTLVVGAKG